MLLATPHPFSDDRGFLNYRFDHNDKIPHDIVTGRDINAHDPRNHRRYSYCHRLDPEHISRVVKADEIGVDFDNREQFKRFFHQLIPTYFEYSPNGNAENSKMHGWYRVSSDHSKLPSAATKNFEAYARLRHLTITHRHVPGTPTQITTISFDEAMRIFMLAGYEPGSEVTNSDSDPGWWNVQALGAILKDLSESIPDFEFRPHGADSFQVRCPGETGWDDGQKHSTNSGLSREAIVWIENGWPCFCCFHAHCRDPKKTFTDLLNHYGVDPETEWERWADSGITGVSLV